LRGSPILRFRTGRPARQQADLPAVVRFMLADVEPFAEIVGRSPRKCLIDGHQPLIVSLAEFRERLLPGLTQDGEVVIEIVALDRLASWFAEVHGRYPLLER